ncbi:hypothetical protein TCAL_14272 [Tigriopus californicus]|uniref:Uncharacterized protein n=1 Tax=Tigriopus californicus TaxID=6832 RepID=A0A553NT32_TIGCA|nr:uncharacterized protein LOC131885482 [Tigriopus californicus]TRY68573.1 hypothetical protein TCAL_14272 [Tigriopus californicus]
MPRCTAVERGMSITLTKQSSKSSLHTSPNSSRDSLLQVPSPGLQPSPQGTHSSHASTSSSITGRKSPLLLKSPSILRTVGLLGGDNARSQSLDTPDTSLSTKDLRRASIANRSKSLNAAGSLDHPDSSHSSAAVSNSSIPVTEREPTVIAPGTCLSQQTQQTTWINGALVTDVKTSKVNADSAASPGGGWPLFFSLPHLIMMSNLQNFLGARNCKKPSIQPNDYMDGLIANMKTDMKERGLHEMTLPDQEIGVALFDGQMSGLTNLSRRGDALLEAETDHFLLTFALQAKDLRCAYGWRKQRLKGEVVANVEKVTLNLKIKQMLPTSTPPELLNFHVEEVDGVQVYLHGLGPLNGLVKRLLRAFLRRHLKDYLERECKDLIAQELRNAATEEGYFGKGLI